MGSVKPIMVRQGSPERSRRAHHERLNLRLSRLKLAARFFMFHAFFQNIANIMFGDVYNGAILREGCPPNNVASLSACGFS